MANNRKPTKGRKEVVQIIYSEPRRVLVGSYFTAKGRKLIHELSLERVSLRSEKCKERYAIIKAKYLKKRYAINPNAVPVKTIIHSNI